MKLAHLRTYNDHVEAHLMKSRLEHEGIPAFIFDVAISTQSIVPTLESAGYRLNVPVSQAQNALSILEKIEST